MTLWPHQRAAIDFATPKPAALLAMGMGTGKSLTALEIARRWQAHRILITCPVSVCRSWEREIREWSMPWRVLRLDSGSVRDKMERARDAVHLHAPLAVIVNHESLWRAPFGAWAMGIAWDALICDESHRAKAPAGRLSHYLRYLAQKIPRRLALTGTPAAHSPLDLYAQFRFLDSRIYGTSYHAFKRRYAVMGGYQQHQVIGFQRTEELWERFSRIAFQARKEDVLTLPPEMDLLRETRLEPKAQRVYDQISRVFWAEIESGEVTVSNALVKLLRLQQISSGWLTSDDGEPTEVSTAKSNLLDDVLVDLTPPVVVFCRFVRDLDTVALAAKRRGWVYGEISGRRKDALDEDARLTRGVDIVGAQIQSGGVGIDLSRASTAIFYSVGFSLAEYLQARARLHRPGQANPVRHIHLSCVGTIDAKILAALRKRQEVVEAILKGGSNERHPDRESLREAGGPEDRARDGAAPGEGISG